MYTGARKTLVGVMNWILLYLWLPYFGRLRPVRPGRTREWQRVRRTGADAELDGADRGGVSEHGIAADGRSVDGVRGGCTRNA